MVSSTKKSESVNIHTGRHLKNTVTFSTVSIFNLFMKTIKGLLFFFFEFDTLMTETREILF